MTKTKLVTVLAKACYYAQQHIDDPDAWSMNKVDREQLLQCTSFQMACFLAQNTVLGNEGVDWDVIIGELVQRPMKSEAEWEQILNDIAMSLGGWRKGSMTIA